MKESYLQRNLIKDYTHSKKKRSEHVKDTLNLVEQQTAYEREARNLDTLLEELKQKQQRLYRDKYSLHHTHKPDTVWNHIKDVYAYVIKIRSKAQKNPLLLSNQLAGTENSIFSTDEYSHFKRHEELTNIVSKQ